MLYSTMGWIKIQLRRLHWRFHKSASEKREQENNAPVTSIIKNFAIWAIAFFCIFMAFD